MIFFQKMVKQQVHSTIKKQKKFYIDKFMYYKYTFNYQEYI